MGASHFRCKISAIQLFCKSTYHLQIPFASIYTLMTPGFINLGELGELSIVSIRFCNPKTSQQKQLSVANLEKTQGPW